MESYTDNTSMIHLSRKHSHMLLHESGIDPAVAEGRGYETVTSRAELLDFGKKQRRASPDAPALRVPLHSPDGITRLPQIKPHTPRVPGLKYETPAGAELIIDVHPRMRDRACHGDEPLLVTEGCKTGDAATSRDIPTVVLAGVWGWCVPKVRPYKLRPCWDHIRLVGREVTICFDSDCMAKEGVQLALAALVRCLEERGAVVKVIYLPDAPDGSKQGIDDFLVAGGTIKEMFMLARTFEPADIGEIRMSQSDKLRGAISYLWREWRDMDWMHFVGAPKPDKYGEIKGHWARGHTARDTLEALIRLATRGGKIDGRGTVVEVGLRRLAEMSAKSTESVRKALAHLEADGQIEILPPKDKGKSRRYRLFVDSARVDTIEREAHGEGSVKSVPPRCQPLRYPSAPRLRWSSPGRKIKRLRGVVPGTRRVRDTPRFSGGLSVRESMDKFPDKPYIKRLGPARGAVVDALEDAGGELTLHRLCEVLHRNRPWDVRRRVLKPLQEAGVIEYTGDVVRLAADWFARLEDERRNKGEIQQAEEQAERRHKDSARYRDYLRSIKDKPSAASFAAVKRSESKRARLIAEHEEHQAKASAAELKAKTFAKRCVHDRMRELGRIRLGLLKQALRDAGGTVAYTLPAAKSLGCTVERLPEFDNQEFVFAPREWAAKVNVKPPPPLTAEPPTLLLAEPLAEEPPAADYGDHAPFCDCEHCAHSEPKYARAYVRSGSPMAGVA